MSKQTLEIRILSCGGMFDLMSEMEALFLVNSLGLYRNQTDWGRAVPRANASLVRAYTSKDFYAALSDPGDILHLIAHADATTLKAGNGKSLVTAERVKVLAKGNSANVPSIVVSTGCSLQSDEWQEALKEAGCRVLIASEDDVTPANLTAFDMAFYAALLTRVQKGRTTEERVREAFKRASRYYNGIHAAGTPHARFSLVTL